ncbi:hypothetical protein CcaverHIS002_0103050 [Cutaneotrichosporon cavernicola]|uniref:Dolichyl-diphosphooligosaccharide--protein glycosyltransferase subunit WBP1 n=1 Tax=Cutaneotrichosporon cavernicola TaxID=279322 RepID=A0AA48HY11_9TREE|nr:uncharacterized protein CcaverHIS019_0102990 [Cutaneotrichosporon cavernicola]BEI79776.1 hypothetical protein CcaverHIS002_0103050 [Cutaneotrichosporon cavernicola]BEI87581.1 hypothetical protein CcaverHIS019_0102990 [Cutaneotrichosporon cavernicola]BEI95352.1 hypothetical protein CcaverHIS631_0103010 [Cutaneotrichosporon cavernicola]BEJ03126.1 hypothetical protein CcaverHIS641_0103010 [Cutaneotrichosporon cavernicola]
MRARSIFTTLLSFAAALVPASARSSTGDRVLVVLGPKVEQDHYKGFWSSLEQRGYELTFAAPGDELLLDAFGVPLHEHLIVFAPDTEKLGKHVTPQALFDAQGTYLNTLYVLSPEISEAQRTILQQYGVEAAPKGYQVRDAFSHVGGHESCCVVLPSSSNVAPEVVLPKTGAIVFPHGTGFNLNSNPLLIDVLRAPVTAYVGDKDGVAPTTKPGHEVKFAGEGMSAVAALQTRANSRIGFIGSPAMLSDKWWGKDLDGKETGNRAALEDLTRWLFQETGVIRVAKTHHHRVGEKEPREAYTKKDEVAYEITIQEYQTRGNLSRWGNWDGAMQLEFTMLDPHIRTELKPVSFRPDGTTYAASFRAPDRHGVFKFVVNHFRPGWTFLEAADRASVVPLRHDEHPRFIAGAYPFYAGCLSTSAAFLFFTALWMHLGESDKGKQKAE